MRLADGGLLGGVKGSAGKPGGVGRLLCVDVGREWMGGYIRARRGEKGIEQGRISSCVRLAIGAGLDVLEHSHAAPTPCRTRVGALPEAAPVPPSPGVCGPGPHAATALHRLPAPARARLSQEPADRCVELFWGGGVERAAPSHRSARGCALEGGVDRSVCSNSFPLLPPACTQIHTHIPSTCIFSGCHFVAAAPEPEAAVQEAAAEAAAPAAASEDEQSEEEPAVAPTHKVKKFRMPTDPKRKRAAPRNGAKPKAQKTS